MLKHVTSDNTLKSIGLFFSLKQNNHGHTVTEVLPQNIQQLFILH